MRKPILVAALVAILCIGAVTAHAAWIRPASGSGKSKAGTMGAPLAFSSPSKTATSVQLSWTAPANPSPTGYVLTRNGGAVAGTCASLTAATIACSDTGLSGSTAYTYVLQAVRTNWQSTTVSTIVTTSSAGDTTPPAQPGTPNLADASDSGSLNSDNITSITTPTFTGTAEANSTIQLFDGTTLVGSGSTNGGGTYTATVTTALGNGTHAMNVKATDAALNQSTASASLTITVDTLAPTVTVTGMSDGTGSSKVTVSGSAGPTTSNGQVTVFLCQATPCSASNDAELLTVNAAANGTWSGTGGNNGGGAWYSSATQTDPAGNTGTSATFGPFNR